MALMKNEEKCKKVKELNRCNSDYDFGQMMTAFSIFKSLGYSEDMLHSKSSRDMRNMMYSLENYMNILGNKKKETSDASKIVCCLPISEKKTSSLFDSFMICKEDSHTALPKLVNMNARFDMVFADYADYLCAGDYIDDEKLEDVLRNIKSVLLPTGVCVFLMPDSVDEIVVDSIRDVFKENHLIGSWYFPLSRHVVTKNNINDKLVCYFIAGNTSTNVIRESVEDNCLLYKEKNVLLELRIWSEYSTKTPLLSVECEKFHKKEKNRDNLHYYTLLIDKDGVVTVADDFDYEECYHLNNYTRESINKCWKKSVEDYKADGYVEVKRPSIGGDVNLRGFAKRYEKAYKSCKSNHMRWIDNKFYHTRNLKIEFYDKNEVNKIKSEMVDGQTKEHSLTNYMPIVNHRNMLNKKYTDFSSYDDDGNNIKGKRSLSMMEDIIKHLFIDKSCISVLDLTAGIGRVEEALYVQNEKLGKFYNILAFEKETSAFECLKDNIENVIQVDYEEVKFSDFTEEEYQTNIDEYTRSLVNLRLSGYAKTGSFIFNTLPNEEELEMLKHCNPSKLQIRASLAICEELSTLLESNNIKSDIMRLH
jgi:hypothetical protein